MTLHKERCECCASAQRTIDKLRADVANLRAALEKLEWSGASGFEECSWCGEYKDEGHSADCIIAKALHTEGISAAHAMS
jgi:hypothetical protein